MSMDRTMAQEYAEEALRGVTVRVAVREETLLALKKHAHGGFLDLSTTKFLNKETIVLNLQASTVFGLLTIAEAGEDKTVDDLIMRLAKEMK